MMMVAEMPKATLNSTARDEARTPAAPLIPQNHGVGRASENVNVSL